MKLLLGPAAMALYRLGDIPEERTGPLPDAAPPRLLSQVVFVDLVGLFTGAARPEMNRPLSHCPEKRRCRASTGNIRVRIH
jgi:hypothetical protein